jgi:hypothetical protein
LEARVTPEGRFPVSENVIGVSPLAVTLKVPAAPSAKLVEAAEVKVGTDDDTVKVKAWVAVLLLASVAVMVMGYEPDVPRAGVPESVPSELSVTPEGSEPVSENVIGVSPVAVTEKLPALFSAKLIEEAEVKTGAPAVTVNVKACVVVAELASVAVMVIG